MAVAGISDLTEEERAALQAIWKRKAELLSEIDQIRNELVDVNVELESLDIVEDEKNNSQSKRMSIGKKKFNMDPKKGIEYLVEHGLLEKNPDAVASFLLNSEGLKQKKLFNIAVASFLLNSEGLNKTAIGEFLGERDDFNMSVLQKFVALQNFTDLIVVQALRQFLWSFRLPGEAQKIDRMMESFAQRYCTLNPEVFTSPVHNPSVKDKPSVEQFINMNRGINEGKDLPQELLESLYESIRTEPFKIPEDDGNDLMHTFFNPDREGWLMKQGASAIGGRYKNWKRRWFIISNYCLYYFEYTTDKEPRGIIPLENIGVREVRDKNRPYGFEIFATNSNIIKACKTDSEGKVVEGRHSVYRMAAASAEERDAWMKSINASISQNPFYDMLQSRKKKVQKK